MNILVNGKWRKGYLDHYKGPEELRIQVILWKDLERIEGLYFVRPRSWRLVWNYFMEIGLRATLRKILSRLAEKGRNEKYVACGLGRVLEPAADSPFKKGDAVIFIVPQGLCAERIVLYKDFAAAWSGEMPPEEGVLYEGLSDGAQERFWQTVVGWHISSGAPVAPTGDILASAGALVGKLERGAFRKLKLSGAPVMERLEAHFRHKRKTAVLFGYGNYAKVNIVPNAAAYLALRGIHEIDPVQLPNPLPRGLIWDTAPVFREGEAYDAAFIAGHHHTHALLAETALRRGMYAVAEKPLATTRGDLERLLAALPGTSRFFASFHKRYLALNDYVYRDLGISPGDPFSYHAIVYEVPLPKYHWYRWESSRDRVLVDGCHWIDHFLYLNNFSPVKEHAAFEGPDGAVNVSLVLENGSFFTMVLTTGGSPRVGVTDHIELRQGEVTITMTNGHEYAAEGADRIIRRRKVPKMACYERMYSEISRKIAEDKPGDSKDSIRVTAEAALALEDDLIAFRKRHEAGNPKL